ncbi:MAG: sensor histidine kinase [Beijerinckiaceae bacterium]|jgi:C4-dicarboxylate-specific signal transduction histidine kinase|nr:sensor histidine kinase [Beijerinckiaceae bacterium]
MNATTPERRAGRQLLAGAFTVVAVLLVVMLAGDLARKFRLTQIAELANLQAERHATQLATELAQFDHLPDIIRYHPSIIKLFENPYSNEHVAEANRYLEQVNAASASSVLYVLDRYGVCIASSNWRDVTSFVGVDLSYRPYFREALRVGSHHFYGIGTTTGVPGYFYGRAIPNHENPVGVGVVKIERLQAASWPGSGRVLMVDGNGVIVLSSEDRWRYRTIAQLPEATQNRMRAARQYENVPLRPLGLQLVETLGPSSSVYSVPDDKGVRSDVLAVERVLTGSDWKVMVLLDLAEVSTFRFWVQALVALTATTIALLVLYLLQRWRASRIELAARAALAQSNSELESEVLNRTQDLILANRQLRETRDELVHSAKLAAIGQIAAGVTHELSQPMAAIRSLSDNAAVFLARGQADGVSGNLRLISDLVDRMSGITGQLKVFARKRPSVLAAVPVRRMIAESLLLLDEKIRRTGARVLETYAEDDLFVRADGDRLVQVFVNLVSNALDAVAGSSSPKLEISAMMSEGRVVVHVRDNGPGLSSNVMAHLFEPFFTTKLAGSGLGLGLAISERILRDFEGTLRGRNAEGGGAVFIVDLPVADAALAETG